MENRILKTIQKYNMIEPNDTVLVALSGGADSVLLAEFLLKYREKLKIKLVCAHVEHGIRGEESLRDFEFVKHWCEKAGVDFKYIHINAPKEASACKMGVEEYSRKKRYEFFETIKCDKIATAHNKSDNIETVLFRMARGTSLNGACGIPAVRGKIIRPLIELTSFEIREYCKDNNIEYVTDSTNLSNDYSRNFIRNVVVNNLKQINPEFENSFSNFIEDINLEENFSNEYAKSVLDRALSEDKKLKKSVLKNETTYINRKVIVEYSLLFGIKLDRNHLLSVEKLMNFNSKSDINERYCFVSNNDFIRIVDKKMHFSLPDYEQTIISYEEFVKNSDYYKKQFDFFCDYDKINAKVFVRKRMDGDKIFLKDRKCSKTLKKLFNENKIPPEIRSAVPIICDDDLIIGVGNFAVSEYVKITQKTRSVLLIKFTEVKMNKDIEKVLVSEEELKEIAASLGTQISKDYLGKNLLLVGILRGSVVFLSDLMRNISIPCKVDFMSVSSYGDGVTSTGIVKITQDLDINIAGYDVLIVEDILDTGRTLTHLTELLKSRQPNSIRICTCLDKPDRRVTDLKADYMGVQIPDEFVVGYGLDYSNLYRNLPYVGVLKPSVYGG